MIAIGGTIGKFLPLSYYWLRQTHSVVGLFQQHTMIPWHLWYVYFRMVTGTGLFLGMGEALNKGGPAGLVLGYLVM
jgi:amino acid permease